MAKYSNGLEDSLDIPYSSVRVLERRYLIKDSSGKSLETGEDMFRRVAKDIAVADAFYLPEFKDKIKSGISNKKFYKLVEGNKKIQNREKEFFELMKDFYFLPNSPTLMNAGRKLQQLSACFVLPMEDSTDKIFDTLKYMAMIHKSGGGTGFSFSRIRPNGADIKSTTSYSPGVISFGIIYNEAGGQITQGGTRRGANMGVLGANHPDALCWTRVKEKEGRFRNFNLSITFTDKEMEAVKNDEYILMEDPREGIDYTIENARKRKQEIIYGDQDVFKTSWRLSEDETKIIDNYTGKEIGKVEEGRLYIKARNLFDTIAHVAWRRGEPGLVFIDRINRDNPTPEIGMIESTNPCGEQPLLPYESCNLGSINLSNMIKFPTKPSRPSLEGVLYSTPVFGEIDWSKLKKTVRSSVRFLDNVIDRTKFPLKKIKEMTKGNRKIGLGVMGFAHMLVKMGISYNSPEAIEKAEYIMKFINETAKDESRKLAKERGSFPNFDKSIYKDEEPIRNATRTTNAPTGTIGVIAAESQGIEPIYEIIARRHVGDTLGEDLIEVNRIFKEYLQEKGLYDDEILRKMTEEGLSIDDLLIPRDIKDEIKRLFVTAYKIPSEQHVKIQAAFQKHTNNAVSKTVNFPNNASKEDVADTYWLAFELNCKGLTIYREGSREKQLLTSVSKKGLENKIDINNPMKLPNILPTIKIRERTPFGNLHVHISVDPRLAYLPVETFGSLGNAGSTEQADIEAIGKLTSMHLRAKGKSEKVIEQLIKIGSGVTTLPSRSGATQSIAMGFAKALLKFNIARENYSIEEVLTGKIDFNQLDEEISDMIKRGDIKNKKNSDLYIKTNNFYNIKCPDCGDILKHEEGCMICHSCGYSKC